MNDGQAPRTPILSLAARHPRLKDAGRRRWCAANPSRLTRAVCELLDRQGLAASYRLAYPLRTRGGPLLLEIAWPERYKAVELLDPARFGPYADVRAPGAELGRRHLLLADYGWAILTLTVADLAHPADTAAALRRFVLDL